MTTSPHGDGYERPSDPIDPAELRLMNSRGRELLLKYWDFPVFDSELRTHGVSLENARILDAGCGSGYTLSLIWQRFHPSSLTAFDIVPSQVEAARARGVPATVFAADITSLRLPTDSFDAVFVCGVLHHCRFWRQGVAEVARVLKSGGVLLIEEPGVTHLKLERLLMGRSVALDAGFSLPTLKTEISRHGLHVLSHRNLYFGLFGSLLCVKGVAVASDYVPARGLLRAVDTGSLASG